MHALRQVDIEQRCDPMGPFVTWEPAVSRMHATSRSKSCTRMPWRTVEETVVLILRAVDTLDDRWNHNPADPRKSHILRRAGWWQGSQCL